jgi:hypothetical protein
LYCLRIRLAFVLMLVLLTTGCTGDGHSRKFRKSAKAALKLLRVASDSHTSNALMEAEAAIGEAKSRIETNQDLHTSEVLGWYAALLHRRDRERTANWRAICDAESEALLSGKPEGRARIMSNRGLNDTVVRRGDCQAAFFQMLTEDCSRTGEACETPQGQ